MRDLEARLDNRPGALAAMAAALGAAQVSLEGGGVFVNSSVGIAHFLIADDDVAAAEAALHSAAIELVAVRDVALTRLRQDVPGQLGALCALLAAGGVNITTQYSDHDGQLVLVVDDPPRAQAVLEEWDRTNSSGSR